MPSPWANSELPAIQAGTLMTRPVRDDTCGGGGGCNTCMTAAAQCERQMYIGRGTHTRAAAAHLLLLLLPLLLLGAAARRLLLLLAAPLLGLPGCCLLGRHLLHLAPLLRARRDAPLPLQLFLPLRLLLCPPRLLLGPLRGETDGNVR
jgi:hypothetical protein